MQNGWEWFVTQICQNVCMNKISYECKIGNNNWLDAVIAVKHVLELSFKKMVLYETVKSMNIQESLFHPEVPIGFN